MQEDGSWHGTDRVEAVAGLPLGVIEVHGLLDTSLGMTTE